MRFVSLNTLKTFLGVNKGNVEKSLMEDLRSSYANRFQSQKDLMINGRAVTPQEVYFLFDLYEKEENRVFSDWVESDEMLHSFLKRDSISKLSKVQLHEGHFLEEKYKDFLAHFLYPLLKREIDTSISKEDMVSMLVHLEISNLLPASKKVELQRRFLVFVNEAMEEASKGSSKATDTLLSSEFTLLVNGLDDTYYAVKVSFIENVKALIENNTELLGKAVKRLKQLELHKSHREEVDAFLVQQTTLGKRNRKVKVGLLLRTPLFYAGLLVILVLIYIWVPKNPSKPLLTGGKPQKRTGLDSLSLAEINGADTLLGYKEDSTVFEVEHQPVSTQTNKYQVIDSKDTLKNKLALALSRSMAADYQIQENQNDTKDCKPLKLAQKEGFQFDGVESLENLIVGNRHLIENETQFDLYILMFENTENGAVYGSFIPAKGKMNFKYLEGMRMVVYSGKELTRFNPLLHKNGGYGSVVYAKRIDERFTAHFCEMNMFNLQLMSKSYLATEKGYKTTVKTNGGPIQLTSDVFVQ